MEAGLFNKGHDADEVDALGQMCWSIEHSPLPSRDRSNVVLVGHSFGARLLSTATFSGQTIGAKHCGGADLLIGLQAAFSNGVSWGHRAIRMETPTRCCPTAKRSSPTQQAAGTKTHLGLHRSFWFKQIHGGDRAPTPAPICLAKVASLKSELCWRRPCAGHQRRQRNLQPQRCCERLDLLAHREADQ